MKNLAPKKQRAVMALIEHGSPKRAAESCGVSRNTLYKWLEDDDFVAALQNAENVALQAFQRQLVSMSHLAADAIRDGLQDSDIRVRLRAADIFTGRLLQLRELLEFEDRLRAVEERLNET